MWESDSYGVTFSDIPGGKPVYVYTQSDPADTGFQVVSCVGPGRSTGSTGTFLYRDMAGYQKNFILKGGALVSAMVGVDTRSTMDIDTTLRGLPLTEDDISDILAEIVSIPLEDGITFHINRISEIMDEAEYPGIRVTMEAELGTTQKARILSVLSTNDEIVAMAHEALDRLQKYDVNSGINLMGTLAKFIDCNYNISLTARELHIHRQSPLYRLEKIESLTEMSLSHHKDLFLLEVFSRIFSDY